MINTTEIGVNYEYLVRDTLRMLSFEDTQATIDLKHDLILKGRSGVKYQIDLYWEFSCCGITQRFVAECKKHQEKLGIGAVSTFHSVLDDLEDCQGVLISSSGFSDSAVHLARHFHIYLIQITDEGLSPDGTCRCVFLKDFTKDTERHILI